MATTTLPIPPGLCRPCVRALSRRLRDVPGVVSVEVDVARAEVRVDGDADPAALAAALSSG
jgi:copper chaperone CopZ